MHRMYLHNDEIRPVTDTALSAGQVGVHSGWGVFSTLKLAGGVLFAFERHWERMKRDARLMRVPFPSDGASLERGLMRLAAANGVTDCTVRVIVLRNGGGVWAGPGTGRDFDVIAFTADSKKWGEYVRLTVQPDARHGASPFAGTKILSWAMNLAWVEAAQEKGFDEVILLNEHGQVSECTSANIFIAEGGSVWTPPLSSGCLPGVTRAVLLEEVRVPGITVLEKPLEPADLYSAAEVFITSTTRDLLRVDSIDGRKVGGTDETRCALASALQERTMAYIESRPFAVR